MANSENPFLAKTSVIRIVWISLTFVIRRLPVVLAVALVFCLPPDLVSEWAVARLLKLAAVDSATVLAYLPTLLSFQINLLGYAALAWFVGEAIEGRAPSIAMAVRQFSGRRLIRILGTLLYEVWLIFWPLLAAISVQVAVMVRLRSMVAELIVSAIVFLAYIVTLIRTLDYGLAEFPAIFENTFFREAALRSKALVRGRRVWLTGAIVLPSVLILMASGTLTVWLPNLLGWPPVDQTTLSGLARIGYGSVVNALITAFAIVFQTLIYFRLRQEKHDLTFFTLSETGILKPAAELAGVTR